MAPHYADPRRWISLTDVNGVPPPPLVPIHT
jgi:hypothetical protein